ncbi:hypothetical protein BH09VER1_BH09VER1_29770 [soil metagenome]
MATRTDVIEALERLWDKYPNMRLGQLVTSAAVFARGQEGAEQVWDVENEEFLEAIHKHLG